jgi:hypothetical protein
LLQVWAAGSTGSPQQLVAEGWFSAAGVVQQEAGMAVPVPMAWAEAHRQELIGSGSRAPINIITKTAERAEKKDCCMVRKLTITRSLWWGRGRNSRSM